MEKNSVASRFGDSSYSYTGDYYYYSDSRYGSYTDESYSYSYSQEKSKNANQEEKNIGTVSSDSEYSYSVSDSKRVSKSSYEAATYDYSEESIAREGSGHHSPHSAKPRWAEKVLPQEEETLFRGGNSKTGSYSYSYSYSEYTSSQKGQSSSTDRSDLHDGSAKELESEGNDAARVSTGYYHPRDVASSRDALSGSETTASSSYLYSYPTESHTPASSETVDIYTVSKDRSHDSSSTAKSAPLGIYYHRDSGSYSSDYYTSAHSTGYEGQSYTYSDDYSYSVTTPYAGHVSRIPLVHQNTDSCTYSSSGSASPSQVSSESDQVHDKADRSTISYGITSGRHSFSSSDTEQFTQRDLITLQTPAETVSHIPPPPRRCFVRPCSGEDSVYQLIRQLVKVQENVEHCACTVLSQGILSSAAGQRANDGGASSAEPTVRLDTDEERKDGICKGEGAVKKNKREGKVGHAPLKPPVSLPTPKGYCSQRTVRLALSAVCLNYLERSEILRNATMPMPEGMLLAILDTCVATRVRDTLTKALLACDPSRCGELPLSVVGGVLRRLGVARSPVLDGAFRINVRPADAKGAQELLLVIESPLHSDDGADEERWRSQSFSVCSIVRESLLAKRPTPVHFHAGNIYMGRFCICRGVPSKASFQCLKTYIVAATYACILVQLFSCEDDVTGQVKVQYPHLIRSLLSLSDTEERKLIYLSNLFRELYCDDKRVAALVSGYGMPPQYAGKDAIESTLHASNDTEEKRVRNVVPDMSSDFSKFQLKPQGENTEEVRISLCLQKVRVVDAVPSGARCYCLVSSITVENVFLPAVEVSVRKVRVSSKKGFTWVFDGQEKGEILFVGTRTDSLYIECCYEVKKELLDKGLPVEKSVTVWCAGYALVPVVNLNKTTTWPVIEGSLLTPLERADAPAGTGGAAPTPPQKRKSFLAYLGLCGGKRSKRVLASQAAVEIKVKIFNKTVAPSLPLREDMPAQYIVLGRHATLINLLRAAVHRIGRQCRHTTQALRQQVVRRILLVASDITLLDQLGVLWGHRLKQMDAVKKGDMEYQHEQLLSCVTTLAALHNCSSEERESFAALAIHRKPLLHAWVADAPQAPILV